MRKLALVLVLLAFTWGGWLRVRQLDAQSFWIDEAFSVVHAQAILEHGVPLLETGRTSWLYPVTHYALAAGMAICDDLHVGARLFPAVCGSLLILAVFWMGRRFGGGAVPGCAAAVVIAFMTFEVACSRQARYYAPAQLMTVLGCLAVADFHDRRTWVRAVLAAAATILAMGCHPSGWMALVFGALLFVPAFRRSRAAWIGLAVVAAALLLLPGVLNPLRVMAAPTFKPDRIANYTWFILGQVGWAAVWIPIGIVAAVMRRDRQVVACAGVVAIYAAYLFFFCPLFHLRYVVPLLPFLVVLGVFGVVELTKRWGSLGVWACGGVAVATLVTADVSVRPFDQYYLGPTAPQPDWRSAFRWMEKDGGPLRTVSNFPEVHDMYATGRGEKYFLPVSLTGRDLLERPNYTTAAVVTNMAEVRAAGPGYLVVDAIGMERSGPDDVRDALHKIRPDHIVQGPYPVFIWRLETLRVSR